MKNSSTRNPRHLLGGIAAAAALTAVSACGGGSSEPGAAQPDEPAAEVSSAATVSSTAGLFADDGGTITFYDDLGIQVLDSDLVVTGRTVDVISGGSEEVDEGGPIEYIFNIVEVDQVLHSSGFSDVSPGDRLKIANFKPARLTIEELAALADSSAVGVFLLFNVANFTERLGDETSQSPADEWVVQTNGSALFRGEDGGIVSNDLLVRGLDVAGFDGLVLELRTISSTLAAQGTAQPSQVLGAPQG